MCHGTQHLTLDTHEAAVVREGRGGVEPHWPIDLWK
jgi:hypothetical protein